MFLGSDFTFCNKNRPCVCICRFFVINFHSPSSLLPQLHDHLTRDMNVLRNRVVRKEVEVYRPCERQACDFGELTDEMRRRDRDLQQLCIKKL